MKVCSLAILKALFPFNPVMAERERQYHVCFERAGALGLSER